jgi:hypothetical protein
MEVGGMEVGGMEVGGMEAGGMEVGGMEAGGGEALGLGSASASGHTGGRTGAPMATPMATRPSSPCHPPKSMCNPRHRPLPSLLHRPIGITVTIQADITPTCSNVQGDGDRWPPRRHKPEATGARAHHPVRLSSVPRCDSWARIWQCIPHHLALIVGQPGEGQRRRMEMLWWGPRAKTCPPVLSHTSKPLAQGRNPG